MDLEHYKKLLLAKQKDLNESISRQESDAREARVSEVGDTEDNATSDLAEATLFETGSMQSNTIALVENALQRIKDGTYGKCLECDRDIEPARLEAVPWAEYCLRDQEKHDRETNAVTKSTL